MKAEHSDKMNRTHEIATNQITEDEKMARDFHFSKP